MKWVNCQKQNLPKLNHKEMGDLNRPMTLKEIESVIRNLPTEKALDWMASLLNSASVRCRRGPTIGAPVLVELEWATLLADLSSQKLIKS